MFYFSKVIRIIICGSSFFYTAYTLCLLVYFLSHQQNDYHSNKNDDITVLEIGSNILQNAILLSIFILQHSCMALSYFKQIYTKLRIEDLERSIYNAASAAALHLLLHNWQTIPTVLLWNFESVLNGFFGYLMPMIHHISWFIIYTGCVMMDFSELVGIKQVYYKISGRPTPMVMKSPRLNRYLTNLRHPSFIGFLSILWLRIFMSVDRLLLASLLSVFMIMMWNTDEDDYHYHFVYLGKKKKELHQKIY